MSKSTTPLRGLFARSAVPWKPHDYQKRAVKWLVQNGTAALFLDPGLGKTAITIAAFSYLKKRGLADRMLIVAPLRVCHQVWPDEADKWKDFQHLTVAVLHGKGKEAALATDADIYCINPEGLEWLCDRSPKAWRALGFDTLAIDELTKFKNPSGKRFKALRKHIAMFSRRWGLTGTPAPNGLMDLFGQALILDEGHALGRYITHYRNEYFTNPDRQGWKWVPQPGAKERIYDKLKPLALRMSSDDYLSLPPLVDVYPMLDLPPKARKLYDELEDDLVSKIEEGVVVAANAAAAGGKLWQVCNGGLYIGTDVESRMKGGKRESIVVHDVKTDWLEELVDELQGTPLLIAYEFHHDLERLIDRFGKRLAYFTGKPKVDKDIENFWNDNQLPLLAAQQDAIAHGLNLQYGGAAHLAHYSMTWNLETFDQIIRRIRRQGTTAQRVFRYMPLMRDTTDEDRRWALARKDKGQAALLEALKARRSGRK